MSSEDKKTGRSGLDTTYDPYFGLDVNSALSHLVEEVSTEEKRAILDRIEQVVSERRSTVSAEIALLKPRSKGYLYPVFVNLLALILIVSVTVVSIIFFQIRQTQIALETSQYFSTEGKILETFKRESEQKLRQKDATIVKILKKLGNLNDKQSEMTRIMEINLEEKKKELERALAAELDLERQRLSAANLADAQIEQTLREREAIKKLEKEQELTEYRRESEQLLREREGQLVSERDITREVLEQASIDRQELLREIEEREEALTRRELELEDEARRKILSAEAKIKRINELRDRENLITDQINSFYYSIIEKIEVREYAAALRELGELERILRDESLMDFPMITKRRSVDLTIVYHLVKDVSRLNVAAPAVSDAQVEAETAQREDLDLLRRELQARDEELARLKQELIGASINADSQQSVRQARESVLKEILRYTEYIESLSVGERTTVGRSAVRDKTDVLFVSVIDAIISLSSGRSAVIPTDAGQFRIIGTVSLVSQDQIVIEKLTDFSVDTGSRVEIRRNSGGGGLVSIAACTVVKVSGDRIIARTDRVLDARLSPAVADRVYIRMQP